MTRHPKPPIRPKTLSAIPGTLQHPARRHCAQNADHLAHNSLFSAFFTEVVCTLSAAPPRTATSLPQNGGNDVIRAATRRRHAASQLLMLHPPPAGQIGNQRRAYSPRLVPNCGAGGRGQDLAGLQNDADHPPAHQAPPFVEGTARPAEPGRGAGGRRGLDGMCTAMKSPTGVEGTGGLGRASRSTTPSRRFTHGGNREARGAWPRCRWVPVGGGRA